jgi:hypothetical protein
MPTFLPRPQTSNIPPALRELRSSGSSFLAFLNGKPRFERNPGPRTILVISAVGIMLGASALLAAQSVVAYVHTLLERKTVCEASIEHMRGVVRTGWGRYGGQVRNIDCSVKADVTLVDDTRAVYRGEVGQLGRMEWATPYRASLIKEQGVWRVVSVTYGDREHREVHYGWLTNGAYDQNGHAYPGFTKEELGRFGHR